LRTSLQWLIPGIVLFGLVSCGKVSVLTTPAAPPPAPVEVCLVERRDLPLEEMAIGTVEPLASVRVKSKVGGEIVAVDFADGATVREGEVLFRIDPRPYEYALQRAEANLAMARSNASNASEQAKRYTTLIAKGSASKEQFAQFLSTAEALQSQLAARQADVDEARLQVEWTSVKSPIGGRAGAALVKRGNIVQSNSEVLAIVNQIKPVYVGFSLPEGRLGDIRARMAAGPLEAVALDDETGDTLGTGTLAFIDNTVDRESGMIAMKAKFPNADEALWPGRFVDVRLVLGVEKDALVVPSQAVSEGQNGPRVFVVSDGVANLRSVEVARARGRFLAIRSGIEAGESVVTSGQLRVVPGGKVTVKNAAPGGRGGDAR